MTIECETMRQTILQLSGLILVALTTFVLMQIGWLLWGDGALPSQGASEASGTTVVEVMAANHLRLSTGEEVWLGGIDVPFVGEPFAEEGLQAVRVLALNQEVRVEGERQGAYVYLLDSPQEPLLQALLLSGGYGRVASEVPAGEVGRVLRQAELEAQAATLGVWEAAVAETLSATPLPDALPVACLPSLVPGETIGTDEVLDHLGKRLNVVFMPLRTIGQSGTLHLMAGLTRDDFHVMIPASLVALNPDVDVLYLNRCMVVTGLVERSALGNGGRIVLQNLEQLTVLR